jgi:hypothetical protein
LKVCLFERSIERGRRGGFQKNPPIPHPVRATVPPRTAVGYLDGAHSSVSDLLFTTYMYSCWLWRYEKNLESVSNGAMNILRTECCYFLLATALCSMNALRCWQLRNENFHRRVENLFLNSQQPYEMAL